MNKAYWIALPLLMSASAAFPQNIMEKLAAEGGIIESTDPEIVSQVERRAAEVVAAQEGRQQQTYGASGTSGAGASGSAGHKPRAHKKDAKAHKEKPMHGSSGTESPAAPK
ncbi:MAG: hypothetical protein JWQ23_2130 [Herminiimonas sp.]|nr:hypothetical protein [Herminiimonas sp.]